MLNDQPQTAALWEELKELSKSVVEEMNRDAELSMRTGGLESRLENGDAFVVSKLSAPQLFLSVRLRTGAIEVYTRLCVSEPDLMESEFREQLTIQNGTSLRNAAGEVFTVEEAVFYILRPFLHLGAADR